MTPEKWNALAPEDKITRSWDGSVWQVEDREEILETPAGHRARLKLRLVSGMTCEVVDGGFWEVGA